MKGKIALFQPYPHSMGGLQAVVLQLGAGLTEMDWEPLIVCPEEGKFVEAARQAQIPVWVSDPGDRWRVYGRGDQSLSYLFSPRRAWQLARYWFKFARELRQREIALLHCNDYRAVMLAAPAARLARIPVIWHMHGYIRSALANIVAALLVNEVAAVSQGMLDYLRLPRCLMRKFRVIHNGREPSPDPSSHLAGSAVILAVGTLHPRKGYETLIRAFAKVAALHPAAECHILGGEFGDGSYARELKSLALQEGVAARVHFRGHSTDVAAEMARCAVFAIPSRIEAFGMVAIEAMAAAKPVVATRTGGLQDIVEHGRTGFLVEEGDSDDMVRHLAALLADQTQRQTMGKAGQERVRRQFTLRRMISSFDSLYRSLLKRD